MRLLSVILISCLILLASAMPVKIRHGCHRRARVRSHPRVATTTPGSHEVESKHGVIPTTTTSSKDYDVTTEASGGHDVMTDSVTDITGGRDNTSSDITRSANHEVINVTESLMNTSATTLSETSGTLDTTITMSSKDYDVTTEASGYHDVTTESTNDYNGTADIARDNVTTDSIQDYNATTEISGNIDITVVNAENSSGGVSTENSVNFHITTDNTEIYGQHDVTTENSGNLEVTEDSTEISGTLSVTGNSTENPENLRVTTESSNDYDIISNSSNESDVTVEGSGNFDITTDETDISAHLKVVTVISGDSDVIDGSGDSSVDEVTPVSSNPDPNVPNSSDSDKKEEMIRTRKGAAIFHLEVKNYSERLFGSVPEPNVSLTSDLPPVKGVLLKYWHEINWMDSTLKNIVKYAENQICIGSKRIEIACDVKQICTNVENLSELQQAACQAQNISPMTKWLTRQKEHLEELTWMYGMDMTSPNDVTILESIGEPRVFHGSFDKTQLQQPIGEILQMAESQVLTYIQIIKTL